MVVTEQLSADDKVLQALELSRQGFTRQEIADTLYTSPDKKNRLSGLRKLMGRKGYSWDEHLHTYVLLENKQEQTKVLETTNKSEPEQTQTKHNKVMSPVSTNINKQEQTLTSEDIEVLKEIIKLFKTSPEDIQSVLTLNSSELSFTDFTGALQGSTIQLHQEVWDGLDDFCKKHKVSKKVAVNEAIWEFLKKY